MNWSKAHKDLGWTPFLWLVYLVFLFIQPVLDHEGWVQWSVLALVIAIFVPTYFASYGTKGRAQAFAIAVIALLGYAYLPFNIGATTFIIYAAALIPFATPTAGSALALIITELSVVALECHWLHRPLNNWVIPLFIGAAVGIGNIYFAQQKRADCKLRKAQAEIEHLAKLAERERIARDLHDVLGHTLSMVILKSELAGRLLDRDPARAASEIRDVEQSARKALAEVREAVSGYRSEGFSAEVERAKRSLQLAGVESECCVTSAELTPAADTVFSLALREAVTNIVRHAEAHRCRFELTQLADTCSLSIEDDGRGGPYREGNGLRGMRERIEAMGGSFSCESNAGTRLMLQLPSSAHLVVST